MSQQRLLAVLGDAAARSQSKVFHTVIPCASYPHVNFCSDTVDLDDITTLARTE
jgi:hypothetical protein